MLELTVIFLIDARNKFAYTLFRLISALTCLVLDLVVLQIYQCFGHEPHARTLKYRSVVFQAHKSAVRTSLHSENQDLIELSELYPSELKDRLALAVFHYLYPSIKHLITDVS